MGSSYLGILREVWHVTYYYGPVLTGNGICVLRLRRGSKAAVPMQKKTDAFPLWDMEAQPTATNIDMIIKKKSTLFHNAHPNRHDARALLAVGCPNHYKD